MNRADVVLIVNADDYGLTRGTNRGIERAHAAGAVTSTSAIVTLPTSAEIADLPRRCPELGVGLHLTLTLGEPICDPTRVRSLTDAEGRLVSRSELLKRLRTGSVVPAEAGRECSAQLERLRSLGIEPDHWNVHQHIEEHVPIGEWAASAMADAGVHVARNPLRLLVGSRRSPTKTLAAVRNHRRRAAWNAIAAAHRTPDALLDAHPLKWPKLAPSLPAGVFEAVCHPSEPDPDLARLTPAMDRVRIDELRAFLTEDLRGELGRRGVALATFAAAFPQ